MPKLLRVALAAVFGITALLFGGPVTSGALLLLLPGPRTTAHETLPEGYTPLHKGHVDLSLGQYVREDEDVAVDGAPALVLRRVSISTYHDSDSFGIGATHNGEWYLIGDGRLFQWAALIRPGEPTIRFERTSRGGSAANAMFIHPQDGGEWAGARLGWTGITWALRKEDGTLMLFRPCDKPDDRCSITRERHANGHVVRYKRDRQGTLLRIEADDGRAIAFERDARGRIVRAYATNGQDVRYEYDGRGRLSRVAAAGGIVRLYTYTEGDQLATIVEPGTDIENRYDAEGRCVRQVNRYPDREPYVFDFAYTVKDGAVVQTESVHSDGTSVRYAFDGGYTATETWGGTAAAIAFKYDRDPHSNSVTALTLTCPDRYGKPLQHSSLVRPGTEDWIKWDLVRTHCSTEGRWRSAE